MKKIVRVIAAIVAIVIIFAFIDSLPKKPYIKIVNDDVLSIEVWAMNPVPPAIKIVDDKETINEIVDILKTVETTHLVCTVGTGGQLVRYTLTLNNGRIIKVGVYGDYIFSTFFLNKEGFIPIARQAKYEPCETLINLGNKILNTGF